MKHTAAVDPHIHLFDVHHTPRPTAGLVRLFGWNEKVLRAVAKRAFPKPTIAFFGERNHLINDYLPTDYRADSASSGVGRYVHVQAGWKDKQPLDAVGETTWLENLDDPPAGIVGYAELGLGASAGAVMAAHKAASSRFRGIRDMLSHHPEPGVMDFAEGANVTQSPGFRQGYDLLATHGLSFDAWCYGHQLAQVAELCQYNPDVPVVLCHVGTPVGIAGEFQGVGTSESERKSISDQWRDGISMVGSQPNAVVKLSGLLMPALGFGYEASDISPSVPELVERLGPMLVHVLDTFGPQRCMFASNFPVDLVSADYEVIAKATAQIVEPYGPEATDAVFSKTAETFYRL